MLRNDIANAARASHEALSLRRRISDRWGIAPSLEDIGKIARLTGDAGTAICLTSAAARLRGELGTPVAPVYRQSYDDALGQARQRLDQATFDGAWERGQAMSLDEAVEMALSVTGRSAPPAGPNGRSAADQPSRLTEREQEVLRLVADGMTNAAIADALFISPATARVHVSNILGKLGARTRTEAVAIARRDALL